LQQNDAKALAAITPTLLNPIFFKEAGEIVNADGPPDVQKLKEVMTRHGLIPFCQGELSRNHGRGLCRRQIFDKPSSVIPIFRPILV